MDRGGNLPWCWGKQNLSKIDHFPCLVSDDMGKYHEMCSANESARK